MDREPDSIRRARPLLGTFVEICVASDDQCRSEVAVEAAFDAVAKVHRLMSFHEQESDVSRLNSLAHREAVEVDSWTFRVLECALDLYRRSGGMFDISIAPALQRLGLLPGGNHNPPSIKLTAGASIELLSGCRVYFGDPKIAIDLGGIAKGFAVDRAIEVLQAYEMQAGLVNAGGDIAAFGDQPWPIHVRHPLDPQRLLSEIALRNGAVASSGGYFDPFRSLQLTSSAIINPCTGRQAGAVSGATVRASSCMMADALTKIVMLGGVEAGKLLIHYGASGLFVSANGGVLCSSDWQGALSLAA